MTEEEIEQKAQEIRDFHSERVKFCNDVGITLDDFFIKWNGDFEIEDMVRAFENGKIQGKVLNEYFVKFEVSHYQELPTTEFYFVKAESGEEAYNIGIEKVCHRWDNDFFKGSAKEFTGAELIDIYRL